MSDGTGSSIVPAAGFTFTPVFLHPAIIKEIAKITMAKLIIVVLFIMVNDDLLKQRYTLIPFYNLSNQKR
jgi:hypothetical protein